MVDEGPLHRQIKTSILEPSQSRRSGHGSHGSSLSLDESGNGSAALATDSSQSDLLLDRGSTHSSRGGGGGESQSTFLSFEDEMDDSYWQYGKGDESGTDDGDEDDEVSVHGVQKRAFHDVQSPEMSSSRSTVRFGTVQVREYSLAINEDFDASLPQDGIMFDRRQTRNLSLSWDYVQHERIKLEDVEQRKDTVKRPLKKAASFEGKQLSLVDVMMLEAKLKFQQLAVKEPSSSRW